ncbi:MAG: hypothetical protein KAG94_06010 [Clostridiales bacterium]|nr:hypothetical protein [Clostridiales bacterium]
MIYQNIEFFNVEKLCDYSLMSGKILRRYFKETIEKLDTDELRMGPFAASYSNECEMRFVTPRKIFKIYLSAMERDGKINIYQGDYYYGTYDISHGKINCIEVGVNERLYQSAEMGKQTRYNKSVWRVVFLKRFTAIFHGIDVANNQIRPPKKEELPSKTFLMYGSSISFGATSGGSSYLSFPQVAARTLGYQVMNKSMPGSCFCEKAVTDMIVACNNVDFFLYEIGGNMRNRYSVEEFSERFKYLMDETRKHHPKKIIIAIDVFWTIRHIPFEDEKKVNKVIDGYNLAMKEYIEKRDDEFMILLDSKSILPDFSLLCADMLHPSAYGHMVMGENLVKEISKYVLK